MKKIISLKDHHFYKYAGLRYSLSEKGTYYCWYQAGPFTIVTGSGKTVNEAEEMCSKLLKEEKIESTILSHPNQNSNLINGDRKNENTIRHHFENNQS